MPEEAAKIEAKSQRQAMEWSLVLASQDIESVIDCGPDEKAWGLLVSPLDYRKAAEAVQLYQEENRHWPWRKQVLRGGLLFDWTSLLWVVVLCLFYVVAAEQPAMVGRGLMDSVAVNHGEIWRMFTAMWLHADLGHLASNGTMGIVLLGLTMGRYGSGTGLLAAYLAGFGGNVAVWLFSLGHASLGASGMVMGSLGLLAAGSFRWDRHQTASVRYAARGIVAAALLFVLVGLSPETDFRAHIGGFVSGVALGAILNAFPRPLRKERAKLAAALVFASLVIGPWAMAFKEKPPTQHATVETCEPERWQSKWWHV